jgi:hypothetical protein
MRTVFGALFLLLAAVLVLIMSQLYLKSLPDMTVIVKAYEHEDWERCNNVIQAGPAFLIFFLTSGAIALSHLPWRDKVFHSLKVIWGIGFFLFALILLYVQFQVFQKHICEDRIDFVPELLVTLLTVGCFILALTWAGGRALGSAFLLIAMGIISALAFSLTSRGLHLSPYGYFTQVVNTILLTAVGAIEIGPQTIAEVIRDRFSKGSTDPGPDQRVPPRA